MERMLLLWDDLDDTLGIVRHMVGNAWHGLFAALKRPMARACRRRA